MRGYQNLALDRRPGAGQISEGSPDRRFLGTCKLLCHNVAASRSPRYSKPYTNPEWVVFLARCNPFRVGSILLSIPKVAHSSQPWAVELIPFGDSWKIFVLHPVTKTWLEQSARFSLWGRVPGPPIATGVVGTTLNATSWTGAVAGAVWARSFARRRRSAGRRVSGKDSGFRTGQSRAEAMAANDRSGRRVAGFRVHHVARTIRRQTVGRTP